MKTVSKIMSFQCNHCEKEYKYDSERKRHELSHFANFDCSLCGKKFNFISAMRRHEKQHERNCKAQCNICSRTFQDEILLKRHMKYAHKGTYPCEKCGTNFSSEAALKSHSNVHKPKSDRRYNCRHNGCDKSFNYPHHLKHHEMTHTNSKQYYCKICKKGFIQQHHLKSHRKTHEPENWLNCTFVSCKKKFPTEYARKRHAARHNVSLKVANNIIKEKQDQPLLSAENLIVEENQSSIIIPYEKDNDTEYGSNEKNICSNTCNNYSNSNDFTQTDSACCKIKSVCNTPLIKYKCDGTVKLMENIDSDIPNLKVKNVPFFMPNQSNCKDILGKCIASADGKVGEGCLCAKMSIDEELISVQEMDEMTPLNLISEFMI